MSDEKLIEMTLAGQASAFGELVVKYQDRLYNSMLRIVGNQEDTQDVVQDSFLQAFANLSRFRQSSQFYTWLYRIAYNAAIGCLNQRRRLLSVAVVGTPGDELVDREEMPDEAMSRQEDATLLWEVIEGLPLEYKAPLILREMEDASYEDIAEILGVPVGTVRSRLHRARIALKDALLRQKDNL